MLHIQTDFNSVCVYSVTFRNCFCVFMFAYRFWYLSSPVTNAVLYMCFSLHSFGLLPIFRFDFSCSDLLYYLWSILNFNNKRLCLVS